MMVHDISPTLESKIEAKRNIDQTYRQVAFKKTRIVSKKNSLKNVMIEDQQTKVIEL